MSGHDAPPAAPGANPVLEFLREVGTGMSATFVLLAALLPLGLIAFAPLGESAVQAGVRAAFAAAPSTTGCTWPLPARPGPRCSAR
jgi:hypothetical protein